MQILSNDVFQQLYYIICRWLFNWVIFVIPTHILNFKNTSKTSNMGLNCSINRLRQTLIISSLVSYKINHFILEKSYASVRRNCCLCMNGEHLLRSKFYRLFKREIYIKSQKKPKQTKQTRASCITNNKIISYVSGCIN